MPARDDARQGLIFAIAGVVAGAGHYLFQALASRALDAAAFADFSAWLAHLTVAFTAGGVVQYLANFHPVARRAPWLIAVNAAALAAAAVAFIGAPFGPTGVVAIGVLAVALGWASGQTQIRLDYFGLSIAQVLNAGAKVLLPLTLSGAGGRAFALALAYLPPLWWLTGRLARAARSVTNPGPRSWGAPILLAIAANLFPQYDLLVTRHAVTAADFSAFARVSLFFKIIYFAVFIFAQWRLPRQIRGDGQPDRSIRWVALFAGVTTLALVAASPLVSRAAFGWSDPPAPLLILAACAHVSLLTLVFLMLQDLCAAGRAGVPAAVLAGLGLEAAIVIATRPHLSTYLTLAIVMRSVDLALLRRISPGAVTTR